MDAEMIFNSYRTRLENRRVADASLREYRITTTRFLEWLREQDKMIDNVRPPDIEDFMRSTDWAPSTQRARMTWLRRPWSWAVGMDLLERTPFNGHIELDKPPSREPALIPINDLRAIKARIGDHRENALFHVLAYTGFRRAEICDLTWNDVSFGAQTIHIIGKMDKERTIPLHPAAADALKGYGVFGTGSVYVFPGLKGGRMTNGGMDYLVKQLVDPLEYTAHAFRRTFATSMTDNGAERAVVKAILGHAQGDVTSFYVKYTQRVMMQAVLLAYRSDPL